jgi:16S rRNA processing protein RimM
VTFDSSDSLIELGVIGRPHGLRGEMRVFLHNAESRILESSKSVFIKSDNDVETHVLSSIKRSSKYHIFTMKGISSREQAEMFKGGRLCILRSELPKLENDEFYIDDLVGIEAWDKEEMIGHVVSSRPQFDIEILSIESETHEFEVPLVDDFLVEIKIEEGRVELKSTESLPRNKLRRR